MTKKSFQFIGEASEEQLEQIIHLLQHLNVETEVSTSEIFNDWLDKIPNKEIQGFKEKADEWIRCWGKGGGDLSTETVILDYAESDNPKLWADSAYENVVNFTRNSFETGLLIMELVNDVLRETNK